MTDIELIRARLEEIDRLVAVLEKRRPIEAERIRDDLELSLLVERSLERAIQSLLDICAHVLADLGLSRAEDYTGLISGMASARILSEALVARIKPMAGLRNILVHEYAHLDADRIAHFVNTRLDDFRDFAMEIDHFLKKV